LLRCVVCISGYDGKLCSYFMLFFKGVLKGHEMGNKKHALFLFDTPNS
jgi:hypothetical protein